MNGATFNQSSHHGNMSGLIERIFRQEHGCVLAALISQFEAFDLARDELVNVLERKLDVIAVLAFEEEPDYVLRAT